MNDTVTVFNLPEYKEMSERLLLKIGNKPFQQEFYQILLKHAGQARIPRGVVTMLSSAIDVYMSQEKRPLIYKTLLYKQIPGIIDVLVRDIKLAKETKKLWKEKDSRV